MTLLVVIVNYRTADLAVDCLASLADQIPLVPGGGRVVVIDNDSNDGSIEAILAAIKTHRWSSWAEVRSAGRNGGFSAGNNAGFLPALASNDPPELVLLINSDTVARPGLLASLLKAADAHPEAGLIGPRLEWPDGTPQMSAFRCHNPLSELVFAAGTGPVTKLFSRFDISLPLPEETIEAGWVSFACVLIRRAVLEQVGPMDEGFFMYFEDVDYCRLARQAGWQILHWPHARTIHLRGGSAPVKKQLSERKRISPYFYKSRSRYFAKAYGPFGPLLANLAWMVGRSISLAREVIGHKVPHTAQRQLRDIWTDWRTPLQRSFSTAEIRS